MRRLLHRNQLLSPQERSQQATTCTLASVGDLHVAKLVYASCPALSHDRPGHPECAARGSAILDALQAASLTEEALPGQASSEADPNSQALQQ